LGTAKNATFCSFDSIEIWVLLLKFGSQKYKFVYDVDKLKLEIGKNSGLAVLYCINSQQTLSLVVVFSSLCGHLMHCMKVSGESHDRQYGPKLAMCESS
jgi:hypothetical protein